VLPIPRTANRRGACRRSHSRACSFAVDAGRGEELAAALVKISTVNKTNIYPDKWFGAASAPPPAAARAGACHLLTRPPSDNE